MIMPKKTLYVFHTESLYSRGGEKYLFELFKRVSKYYTVIMYFESVSTDWGKLYRKEGIEIRKLWKPNRFYWFLLPLTLLINAIRLKKTIKKSDVVFATNFPVNLLAIFLSKKTICHCFEPLGIFYDPIRIKLLPLFSKVCVSVAKSLYARADNFAIHHSTVLTTLNVSVEKHILNTYGRKPDMYIPNGVDPHVFSPKKNIKKKNEICVIGHSTDYTVFKGTTDLLKAIALVAQKTKKFRVLISESITDLSVKKIYMRFLSEHKLNRVVRFTGNLTEKQLVHFYQNIDVFCYAGSPECAGGSTASLSVIEAQACGTPVIRSRGNDDEIVHGKTGYYIDPSNPMTFAEQIVKFTKRKTKDIIHLRQAAVRHVKENFQWDVSSTRVVKIVRSLTS